MNNNEPFYPIEQGQGWAAACTQAFCSDRDWKAVNSFYATQVIAGDAALEALGIALIEPPPPPPPLPPLPAGQLAAAAARVTFKIHLGYYGPAFTGWQWSKQAGSVEQAVRTSLEHLLQQRALADGGGAGSTSQPPAVVVSVAGRTDRGVNAVGQVASFYTFDSQLPPQVPACASMQLPVLGHAAFSACMLSPACLHLRTGTLQMLLCHWCDFCNSVQSEGRRSLGTLLTATRGMCMCPCDSDCTALTCPAGRASGTECCMPWAAARLARAAGAALLPRHFSGALYLGVELLLPLFDSVQAAAVAATAADAAVVLR